MQYNRQTMTVRRRSQWQPGAAPSVSESNVVCLSRPKVEKIETVMNAEEREQTSSINTIL